MHLLNFLGEKERLGKQATTREKEREKERESDSGLKNNQEGWTELKEREKGVQKEEREKRKFQKSGVDVLALLVADNSQYLLMGDFCFLSVQKERLLRREALVQELQDN